MRQQKQANVIHTPLQTLELDSRFPFKFPSIDYFSFLHYFVTIKCNSILQEMKIRFIPILSISFLNSCESCREIYSTKFELLFHLQLSCKKVQEAICTKVIDFRWRDAVRDNVKCNGSHLQWIINRNRYSPVRLSRNATLSTSWWTLFLSSMSVNGSFSDSFLYQFDGMVRVMPKRK